MTVEEKAKAYDEAIERARIWKDKSGMPKDKQGILDDIFPELKESEDERIRRELIEYFSASHVTDTFIGIPWDRVVAWLEKQGERSSSNNIWHNADEIPKIKSGDRSVAILLCSGKIFDASPVETWDVAHYYSEYGFLYNGQTVENSTVIKWAYLDELIEKQGEQKPVDKVEPKFKIGDIITNDVIIGKVDENENNKYHGWFGYDKDLSVHCADIPDVENWHKWTIQDAKDGDVLLSPLTPTGDIECPFIFKEIDKNGVVRFHAALLQSEELEIADGITNVLGYANAGYHIPAAKEQRDLLFREMKEAGYEWDAEKKELKKIITPIYNIGDRVRYKGHACDGVITEITDTDYMCGNAKLPISTQDKLELVEQKPTDKVEPKFKVGDKIQYLKGCGTIMTIEKIENGEYIFANSMGHTTIESGNKWHLVDIIEQKPAWSKKDTNLREATIGLLNLINPIDAKSWGKSRLDCIDWLKSIKDRVLPQKQEWSEEDEKKYIEVCENLRFNSLLTENAAERYCSWLKSLRSQKQWKPSDEQMMYLSEAIDVVTRAEEFSIVTALKELREQLMKLREE